MATANVSGAERPRASTKRAVLIGMLERPEGASVAEIGQRLGWLPHTVRAAFTGLRHAGREVTRSKDATGLSVYRARSGRNCSRPVTAMAARQKYVCREALSRLPKLDIHELREEWRSLYKAEVSPHLSRELLIRAVAYRTQEVALGGLRPEPQRQLRQIAMELKQTGEATKRFRPRLKPGTRLIREWQGRTYEVVVLDDGFSWQGTHYRSLSAIARKITGTAWSGPLFFGLKPNPSADRRSRKMPDPAGEPMEGSDAAADPSRKRCAIYTRKSSEEGLEQEFNSLQAQSEACEAYIRSQRHEGWILARTRYDDGGFSGGNMERPALQRLLADIQGGRIDIIVVYKVDRLTRSLADFARLVEIFDAQGVSFVSVTQQFNTTSSMGRLTLNVLLSFAQFEREVTGERIRDKIAASKKKGMWMGGNVPLGYDASERTLVINPAEAETVRRIFALYRELGCVRRVKDEADRLGLRTKRSTTANGIERGGKPFSRGHLYRLLSNPIYIGQIAHKGQLHPGQHRR